MRILYVCTYTLHINNTLHIIITIDFNIDFLGKWEDEQKILGIFNSALTKWLGLKLANSGFPADIVTEAEKDAYVTDMNAFHHTNLKKSDFVKNVGIRQVSKDSLNCVSF